MPGEDQVEALLTSIDVAKLLRVPTRTLDAWAYKGVGPKPIRVGRHRRYMLTDVLEWIDQQRAASSE